MKSDRLLPSESKPMASATTTRLVGSNPARQGDMRAPQRQAAITPPPAPPMPHTQGGILSSFISEFYLHFNAGSLKDAAEAYVKHLDGGGWMYLAMAGAMSTGEIGKTLAPMIRAGKVHGISCTGANLEEDMFNLIARDHYERFPDYQDMTPPDDIALAKRKINRVTDTGIPEKAAMAPIEEAMQRRWQRLKQSGTTAFPHELFYDIIRTKELASQYEANPDDSWLVAAAEVDLPIHVPGAEDSTLGNVFAAQCYLGRFKSTLLKNGYDAQVDLMHWYLEHVQQHPMGFFQLGGGIAGDFPICTVPCLIQDAHIDVPLWSYFAQVKDAQESMGGYSGAMPSEKRSWGKLPADCPAFSIDSDASIVWPLIAARVLGW